MFKFEIVHESSKSGARVGRIHTAHGVIDTPNYVPVGTNGTLKACDNALLSMHDCQLMFCNTYHLALHPGGGVVEKAGGLHRFIGRDKPIITDSGGFQVFSLAYGSVASELKSQGTKKTDNAVIKISERGVKFRSYRDGSIVEFTPESSIQIQKQLGADIIIPFDELPPFHVDSERLKKSFERTHRWQERSIKEHFKDKRGQAIYGVVHGGCDHDLRKRSCELLGKMGFDGYAIGGSLGKTKEDLYGILKRCTPHIPKESPRHLLGIADIPSIDEGVLYGIDTFDSCYPTRAARHGVVMVPGGKIKISSGRYREDFEPIDKNCPCWTCRHYTRAYIHHLFKAYEPSAYTLATVHNVQQMMLKMASIREAISQNKI
ncbi:MAG: tRNA guanosine(34) transglycosylase Tgt [Pseudomonadota bacterium]|nr:tRNA guanosine(34) transglycosylase Tgt [Pseudomonadota bacterium]